MQMRVSLVLLRVFINKLSKQNLNGRGGKEEEIEKLLMPRGAKLNNFLHCCRIKAQSTILGIVDWAFFV